MSSLDLAALVREVVLAAALAMANMTRKREWVEKDLKVRRFATELSVKRVGYYEFQIEREREREEFGSR